MVSGVTLVGMVLALFSGGLGSFGRSTVLAIVGVLLLGYGVWLFMAV